MPSKKNPPAATITALVGVARLAYDVARPATCPNCGGRTFVFVCINCPRVVVKPQRR